MGFLSSFQWTANAKDETGTTGEDGSETPVLYYREPGEPDAENEPGDEPLANLQVTLDAPETLLGPTWKLDTQFNTVGRVPSVIGYVSNTNAWAYSTSNLSTLTLLPGIALLPGTAGKFDSCGVWLNSTYKDGSIVRGWYHAETHPSTCDASPAHKSVGYAESYDGGLTFVKPSYPNNKVISAPSRYTDPEDASEGDSHVIKVGNYFYMYFVTPRDSYKIHLARSLVTDGGKPGTWWKYYNGTFSQPGIGGESSALASGSVLGRAWVSYNTAVGEYMGFSWSSSGFGLSLSPDGINWRRVTGDILSTNHQFHNRNSSSGELIDYMSLIGLDGDPALTGSDVWLYYMRVPAGQPMVGDTRYLVRRKLHIGGGNSSSSYTFTPQLDARVEQANPTTNFGGEGYLRTNGGAEPQVESYLRFSASGISGSIQSAKLRVYSYNGTVNGPAAYSTGGSWTEMGLTWNNKPARGGTAYDDKGSIGVNTWVEFNVTPMVSGNGTYNFMLSQNNVDGFYFYSREGTYPPQLVVTTTNP